MKNFILTFDGMSFTTDPDKKTDFTMTDAQASEIMAKCGANGGLPNGVIGIVAARVFRDEADAPDGSHSEECFPAAIASGHAQRREPKRTW